MFECEKVKSAHRASYKTMPIECRQFIDNYLMKNKTKWSIGNTVEETKKSIMNLEQFKSGCFTYIQARVFAEYYHSNL